MKKHKLINAIIEARMSSTRLPGKVMFEVNNIPLLGHLINRLKNVNSLDKIILATTINPSDNILVDYAKSHDISVFRGSELNVMERVIQAATLFETDIIVEITGDCPLIDHNIIEQIIRIYKNNDAAYVSNSIIRSYPDGMDTQVFSLSTLQKSFKMTNSPLDLEHVTRHIRNNKKIFNHINLLAPPKMHWPELGLTLDEYDDYIFIKKIINNFTKANNSLFTCSDIINYLRDNMYLLKINSNVKRTQNN